ncbi:MAG: helix-turn-helix domain-containing protein [Ruminococcaceae bacterium]|nr:helix-turn-helix domain-containing protein [Oscillospiraceae bacterium]
MMDFAKTVAEQRKKLKMTQEELAQRLGITPQAVSKWENSIGLPDVTLFPLIAETLQLSINDLFGIPERSAHKAVAQSAPQDFEGLSLVTEHRGMLCYSNKEMKERIGDRVLFSDGSIAELDGGRVINRGAGEVRLIRWADAAVVESVGECVTRTLVFEPFSSMTLSLAHKCTVKILSRPEELPRMVVKGREGLLDRLETRVEADTLTVRLESNGNHHSSDAYLYNMEIFVPFISGNGLKLTLNGAGEASVEPHFVEGEVSINGCGNVAVGNFDRFTGRISGSGDITAGEVQRQTKLRVAGSGDITLSKMSDPDVRIAGSGDITCAKTEGHLKVEIAGSGDASLGHVALDSAEIRISGSGDISMRGEVSSLRLKVAGSGNLEGTGLTVDRAALTVNGSGEIKLERIISESEEQLSREATLQVAKRG